MTPRQRLRLLKLAQTAAATPAVGQTTNSTTTNTPTSNPITVDINNIPGFRPQLFAARPDIINDLNRIIGIVNKYLQSLSQNRVNFTQTWTNPSINASEFVNSVKNLYSIAKWLLSVIRSQTPQYTIQGLAQIANGLIQTVQRYSFPEPQAANIPNELINSATAILNRLGVART